MNFYWFIQLNFFSPGEKIGGGSLRGTPEALDVSFENK